MALAQPSKLGWARVRNGLRILRLWLRRHPDSLYIRPGRVARELGLGLGAAQDVGYALSYWERIGLVAKDRENPARYVVLHRLVLLLETRGCLEAACSEGEAPCGLVGTLGCPFLEGVEEP